MPDIIFNLLSVWSKNLQIFLGNLRQSLEIFVTFWKFSENVRTRSCGLRTTFEVKWSEIFGKSSKTSFFVCLYGKQNNTWCLNCLLKAARRVIGCKYGISCHIQRNRSLPTPRSDLVYRELILLPLIIIFQLLNVGYLLCPPPEPELYLVSLASSRWQPGSTVR